MSLLIGKLGAENDWCEQASIEQLLCDVLEISSDTNALLANCNGMMSTAGNGSNDGNGSQSAHNQSNMLIPLVMK